MQHVGWQCCGAGWAWNLGKSGGQVHQCWKSLLNAVVQDEGCEEGVATACTSWPGLLRSFRRCICKIPGFLHAQYVQWSIESTTSIEALAKWQSVI
jgi:hypothetical protein